ncbi:MAG TPA: acyl carrier protein, partial [Polyangiaceae bacterium]
SLKVQIRGELREALQAKLQRPLRLEEEELPFSALGLDSIALLELASKLEERYDVTLADFAAYEHPTLGSLAAHVAELLEAKPAASGGAPAREPAAGASSAARHELELPLWPIREGS